MNWKDSLPKDWVWNGMRWKGNRGFPVYIFKNTVTGLSKGFSGWEVQPPTKERAVQVLKDSLGVKTETT